MSLINWRKNGNYPGSALVGWAEDLFKDDDGFFDRPWNKERFLPAVNVEETDNAFNLEVAAPGMEKKDFKLEVDKGMLRISAETETSKEDKTDHYTRKEFDYRSFERSFWLPENVKVDGISANYKDGILVITVPKLAVKKEEAVKKIKIA
jgi:HSP20 family protein